jgi:hypothetical protein
MRCYPHLSDDEREQTGLAKALGHSIGAIAQAIAHPKSTAWRELSATGCRAGATRCVRPTGPINCEDRKRPSGPSLSTGSQKGCQRQWETDPLGNSNLTNPPRWFLRQGGADANSGGTDGIGYPEEPRGKGIRKLARVAGRRRRQPAHVTRVSPPSSLRALISLNRKTAAFTRSTM